MININIFFVYSFIGFLYECILNYVTDGVLESGFMYGPWTPIYGISVLIILYVYNKIKSKYRKEDAVIVGSIICMFILTILEFISGNLLQILFSKIYWNYSNFKFNIGKYIALEVSVIWGIMSAFVMLIHPYIEKIIKKIPKYLTYILIVIFIIDIILSFIHLL